MRSKAHRLFSAFLTAAILALPAAAMAASVIPQAIEGRYGPEFTFTFDGGVSVEKKNQYVAHLRRHLKDNQPEGAKFRETGSGYEKFTSPNEWWFEVTTNPGVLEIKMSPLTVKQTRAFKSDIQDAIFTSAAAVGLFPWDYLGGGHLNFDLRIFGGSIMLARNFLVDFWNHNELSMGILSYDTNNAVPYALFNDREQSEIAHIIARADAGEWNDNDVGVMAFFKEINRIAGSATNRLGGSNKGKHHDLNLAHVGRVEIRSVRPQANMDVWLSQIELIESRINNHLRFIETPLPFKARVPLIYPITNGSEPESNKYVPPIDPQLALKSFHQYVTESRLDWKDHRVYVWPPWFRGGELEKFEATAEFKVRDRMAQLKRRARSLLDCKGLLSP